MKIFVNINFLLLYFLIPFLHRKLSLTLHLVIFEWLFIEKQDLIILMINDILVGKFILNQY